MTITVYSISGAPRPWRVLLGLAFKGLEYEIALLELSRGDLKSKAFLTLNPRGTVPVLVDGPVSIADSIGALAWLDRAYPERPLFGDTAEDAARVWQATMDVAEYLRNACDRLLSPIFFKGVKNGTPALIAAAGEVRHELGRIEAALAERSFLVLDGPTAADAAAFPEVRILQRAVDTRPEIMAALGLDDLAGNFPSLDAWKRRVENLPAVEKTFPPHWTQPA